VQPGAAMEYDLTTSIKKLAIKDKPKIGLIQGHGEPSMQEVGQFVQQLMVMYQVVPVVLNDANSILSDYKNLVWINPADTINSTDFQLLDNYIQAGGNLFLAKSNVSGDLQNAMLNIAPELGITPWLSQYGLQFGNQFVIDAQNIPITVQQRQGFFTINSQRDFPYFVQVNNFEEHPTTKGLETILLPFINSIYITNSDTSLSARPLMYSSEMSGLEPGPRQIMIDRQWTERDFSQPRQILAASVENIGQGKGKIIAIANGDFLVNGEGQGAQQLNADNVNFASNAVDWLTDDTGLIDLRTKGVTNRPLDSVEDGTRDILKYGNVFAPILLLLLYAFYRKTMSSRKRNRWMQGNYK
jgi:ABC-type uncharacterized transport system involved in gliding motility auxiliary subunit